MDENTTGMIEKSGKIAFSERELEVMGLGAAKTFKGDRYRGRGIPHVRIGRRIRYLKSDLLNYLKENRVVPNEK